MPWYPIEDGRWLQLAEQPRPQYEREGQLILDPFDGKERDVEWHRLMIDARIPQGTSLSVETRCANDQGQLEFEAWKPLEAKLYLRGSGSELPFEKPLSGSGPHAGIWETLFQEKIGRFLQLRIRVRGSGRTTPKIFSLRAWYPRFDYAKSYLPSVYQRDRESASFLKRFLANFEGAWSELEGRIRSAEMLLDVDACPDDYLSWLGQWLGIAFDDDLDESRRRLFLSHAIELYRQRGTKAGLLRMLRLSTDRCVNDTLFTEAVFDPSHPYNQFAIRLVESFESLSDSSASEEVAHAFKVFVPFQLGGDGESQRVAMDKVRRVLDREKPAHTSYELRSFLALFVVGEARVSYDTVVGEGSRYVSLVLGNERLASAYLGTEYPFSLTDRNVVGALGRSSPGTEAGGLCCDTCPT